MPQLELFHIPSPCIGICQNGTNGFCKGCFRSRDERYQWMQLNDEGKRHVIKLCKSRKVRWVKKEIEIRREAMPKTQDPTPDLFGD
jgi:uncharacterized protein